MAQRFSIAPEIIPQLGERAPQGAIAYLKRLYYDTAISATPYTLSSLQELVEPTQILFGTDYPYMQEHFIEKSIQELATYDGFNNDDRQLIERDNALKLFPRLRGLKLRNPGL